VAIINADLEIPDWNAIRRQLDARSQHRQGQRLHDGAGGQGVHAEARPAARIDEIAKKALREWGKAVRKAARANAWKNAERTKQQMTYKVKRYKRAVWAGVGVKTDKIDRKKKVNSAGRKSPYVGWKAHFMEVGWHAWPKGVRGNVERGVEMLRNRRIAAGEGATRQITVYRNGKPHVRTIKERARTLSRDGTGPGGGRGWRKGVRGRLGRFLTKYARHYMWRAAQVGRQLATNKVIPSINDALRSAARTA